MAEINPPYALQGGAILHPAILFRRTLAGLVGEGVAGFVSPTKALPDDLKVTENSPAGMSVLVGRGGAFVQGDDVQDQGMYFVYNDASKVLTVPAADGTNPRKDIVVARVEDDTHGQPGDVWSIEYITGTPAASPAEPSIPATAYRLASVDVPAGASSVTNANITNRRERPVGGTLNAFSGAKAVRNSDQSNPNNSDLTIDFGNEQFDTHNYHDNATQNSRLTVPTDFEQYFQIDAQVRWATSSAGRRRVRITINDAVVAEVATPAAAGGNTTLPCTWKGWMAGGDYAKVLAFQDSGGPIDVIGAADGSSTWFAIEARGR